MGLVCGPLPSPHDAQTLYDVDFDEGILATRQATVRNIASAVKVHKPRLPFPAARCGAHAPPASRFLPSGRKNSRVHGKRRVPARGRRKRFNPSTDPVARTAVLLLRAVSHCSSTPAW